MTKKFFFSPFLSRPEKEGFGDFRSFQIHPDFIKETGKIYTLVDNTGIHPNCPVYEIIKPIKLSTSRNGEGRPFLPGPKKKELSAGSFIYLIPYNHKIYTLDSWTRFDVLVRE